VEGSFKSYEHWVLDTIGNNLVDVLALDYIDVNRTVSNNILEMYNVLGIEAARQSIYNELVDVIAFDDTYINTHHLDLLCDRMTYNTKMTSIFRHGINNDHIGPIAKAAFEETPEMFLRAARHGEVDLMKGVSANIMCGQEGYFGTSAFQVLIDGTHLRNVQDIEDDDDENTTSNKKIMKDDGCSIPDLHIENNAKHIKAKAQTQMDDDYMPDF
jgi:DNA-directed RNA polymerase II subunit RPB1